MKWNIYNGTKISLSSKKRANREVTRDLECEIKSSSLYLRELTILRVYEEAKKYLS